MSTFLPYGVNLGFVLLFVSSSWAANLEGRKNAAVDSISPPAATEPPPVQDKAANTEINASTSGSAGTNAAINTTANAVDIVEYCKKSLGSYKSYSNQDYLSTACSKAMHFDECNSVSGKPIYHLNRKGEDKRAKNVLVFSLIHGDETHAGTAGRFWIERLQKFEPRNNWRIIPVLNPDGVHLHTRTNGNKVDLNRNFPTKDWDELAISHWKASTHSNPRRFPGPGAASEPETKCAVKHIEDYRPDFVVSIHTPLRVLDFDGPKVKVPKYTYLPWKALGHYPGSLGRYMWHERSVPTLTMELREDLPSKGEPFEQLQDIIGTLVLLDGKRMN